MDHSRNLFILKLETQSEGEWQVGTVCAVLTGAIKVVGDGIQEGVLRSEEALHHRHLAQDYENTADSADIPHRGPERDHCASPGACL